jgi:hypothetical protein
MDLKDKVKTDIFFEKKFFTLWDVIKLDLTEIAKMYENLCKQIILFTNEYSPVDAKAYIEEFRFFSETFKKESKRLNLIFSLRQLDRLNKINQKIPGFKDSDLTRYYTEAYKAALVGLKTTLEDELSLQICYRVSTEYQKFLENQFANETIAVFPDLEYDMKEACTCIAFERFTASAFHLMRIIEGGIKELSNKLNVKLEYSAWGRIIKELNKFIDGLPKTQKKQADELRDVLLSFTLVKDAWRNPTMHFEKKYTGEEVLEIFGATNNFLAKIAKKLK